MVLLQAFLLFGALFLYCNRAAEQDAFVARPSPPLPPQQQRRVWQLSLPTLQLAEAGIPGLHKWMLETFPSAAQRLDESETTPIETDHLLFDLNQLLHQAAASVKKCRWQDRSPSASDGLHKRKGSTSFGRGSSYRRRIFTPTKEDTIAGRRSTPPLWSLAARREAAASPAKTETESKAQEAVGVQGVHQLAAEEEEELVLRRFLRLLSATLRRVRPRRSVVFALDGVPPLAKFLTATARHQRAVWQRTGGLWNAGTPEESQSTSRPLATEANTTPAYVAAPPTASAIPAASASGSDPSPLRRCETGASTDENPGQQLNEDVRGCLQGESAHSSQAWTHEDREDQEHVVGSLTRVGDDKQEEAGTVSGGGDALPSDTRQDQQLLSRQTSRDPQAAALLPAAETGAANVTSPPTRGGAESKVTRRETYEEVEGVQLEATAESQSVPLQTDSVSRYRIPPYLLIPGTRFMDKVEEACRRFARQRLSTRRDSNLRFFISGSNSHGEGELKLVDWLNAHRADEKEDGSTLVQKGHAQENAASQKGTQTLRDASFLQHRPGVSVHAGAPGKASVLLTKRKRTRAGAATVLGNNTNEPSSGTTQAFQVALTDRIVIVGGDGDLLVQALAFPGVPNLYVYCPQRLLDSSNRRHRVFYSLRSLLQALERHFPGCSHLVRNDFALLCLLNGNDYLPKAGGFTFQHFFQAYTAVRKRPEYKHSSLVDAVNRSFNVEFFSAFLEELDSISSLWRIALQQILAPASGPPNHMSPLAIVNQLVAQGYLSLSLNKGKNAFVRESGVRGTTDTGHGRGDPEPQCKEETNDGRVCRVVASFPQKQANFGRQFSSTAAPSTLQWRYEGNTPFGSGNFRAVLCVPCKALPAVSHPSDTGRESDGLRNSSVGPGAVLGDDDAGARKAVPVDGVEEDFVCFTGHARDKKGAQQQAALELLQRYFPAWLKHFRTSETSEEAAREQDGAEGPKDADGYDCGTGERNTQEEPYKTQEKGDGKQPQVPDRNLPNEWRLAAPLFSAAASTLQATSPANTLNNLCLKVFKQPAKLWHVVPQRAPDTLTEPDSTREHDSFPHAHDLGPSVSAGALSAASPFCADMGGDGNADTDATARLDGREAHLVQTKTFSAVDQTDRQNDAHVATSAAVNSAGRGDLERPHGQPDALIALDVGNLRLFSASSDGLVKGGSDSGAAAKLQQPKSRRQEKHCFSMQVLQWLAPSLYRALLAAGWQLDGTLAEEIDARHQSHCENEAVRDEKQPPDGLVHGPSSSGKHLPCNLQDRQQQDLLRGLDAPDAQVNKLATCSANCKEQPRSLVQQSLTSYFTSDMDQKSCEAQDKEDSCTHLAERESASTKQHCVDGAVAHSPHQHPEREAAERAGTDREAEMVEWQVERDAPRVSEYLRGLLWNMQMYVSGVCPDTRWFFPFRKAPSLYSVQEYIKRGLAVRELGDFEHAHGAAGVVSHTGGGCPPISTRAGVAAERIHHAPLTHVETASKFSRTDLLHERVSFSGDAAGGRVRRPIWASASSPVSGNPVSPALYAAAILPPVVFHWLRLLPGHQQRLQIRQGRRQTDTSVENTLKCRQNISADPGVHGLSSSWTNRSLDVPAEALVVERGLGPAFARALVEARDLLERIRCVDEDFAKACPPPTGPEACTLTAHCRRDERPTRQLARVTSPFPDGNQCCAEFPLDRGTWGPVPSNEQELVQNNVKDQRHYLQDTGALFSAGANCRRHDADYPHVQRRPPELAKGLRSLVTAPRVTQYSSCAGEFSAAPDVPSADSSSARILGEDSPESTGYLLSAAESAAPASSSLSPGHILSASLLLARAAASVSAPYAVAEMPLLETRHSCGSEKFTTGIRRPGGVQISANESNSRCATIPFTNGARVGKGTGGFACTAESTGQSQATRAPRSFCFRNRGTTLTNEPAAQGLWMSTTTHANAFNLYPVAVPQQRKGMNASRHPYTLEDLFLLYTDEKQDTFFDSLSLLSRSSGSVWTCMWLRDSGGRSGGHNNSFLSWTRRGAWSSRSATAHTADKVHRRIVIGNYATRVEAPFSHSVAECEGKCRFTGATQKIQEPEKRTLGRRPAAVRAAPIWRLRSAAPCVTSIAEEEVPLFSLIRMNTSWTKSMLSSISGRATDVRRHNKQANGQQRAPVPNTADFCTLRKSEPPPAYLQAHLEGAGQHQTVCKLQTGQDLGQELQQALFEQVQEEVVAPGKAANSLKHLSVAQQHFFPEEQSLHPQQQVQCTTGVNVERALPRQLQQPFDGTPAQQDQQMRRLSGRMQGCGEVLQTRHCVTARVYPAIEEQPTRPPGHDRHASHNRLLRSSLNASHSALRTGSTAVFTASRPPGVLVSLDNKRDMVDPSIKVCRGLSAHGNSLIWRCSSFSTALLSSHPLDLHVRDAPCSAGLYARSMSRVVMKDSSHLCGGNHGNRRQTRVYCGNRSASSSLQNQSAHNGTVFSLFYSGDIVGVPSASESDGSSVVPAVTFPKKCSVPPLDGSSSCTTRYVASTLVRDFSLASDDRTPLQGTLKKQQAAAGYPFVSGSLPCSAAGSAAGWRFPAHMFAKLSLPGPSFCQWCCERYTCCGTAGTHVSCAACGNRNMRSLSRSAHHKKSCASLRLVEAGCHTVDATRTFLLTNVVKSPNTPLLQAACRDSTGTRQSSTPSCTRTCFNMHQARSGYSLTATARAVGAAACLQLCFSSPRCVGRRTLCAP